MERFDRLIVATHGCKQAAEFVECRSVRRISFGRALEARQRVIGAAGAAQRDCQLRIDLRVVAAARCGLERGDDVLDASLHKQCITENVQRAGVLRMIAKNVARDLLGFTRPLAVQGQPGTLDERVAYLRPQGLHRRGLRLRRVVGDIRVRLPSSTKRRRARPQTLACRAVTITGAD